MPCGCAKKNAKTSELIQSEMDQLLPPTCWGPILWTYLHCIAERIGLSGNKIIDTDQANFVEILVTSLPSILPCTECQAHTAAYLAANPFPSLKGLYGDALRNAARVWLFTFHNYVREFKGQPIIADSPDFCKVTYSMLSKADYTQFVQCVAAAVRQGWVRIDQWRKWYSYSERLRILSGNIIV